MHVVARLLLLSSAAAFFAGCTVQPAPTTLIGASDNDFGAAALSAPATPAGPLPAPPTRDPSAPPPASNEGFTSPPSDTGGNSTPTPTPPTPTPTPAANADPYEGARAFCVQRINQYRASVGLPALARATFAESCVDRQAQYDAAGNRAHGAFSGCGELAQNECPGWGGALTSALPGCLASMWSEGPGGGHYDTMVSRSYQYVACGVVQSATGWWVIQDFR